MEPLHTTVDVNVSIKTETPANVSVLNAQTLRTLPGVNVDDRLRIVPGFSLFRRSSSLVANPTTQGVSLRGIGSSGASRTLILWDGIPLNDPFGGWVYWTRVSSEEIDRVEVSRGAAVSAFGDRALGGVVSLFSRPAETGWHGFGGAEFGTQSTQLLRGGASWQGRQWGASVSARAARTDGYYIVPRYARGRVDDQANVDFASGLVRLDWIGNRQRFFAKFDALAEERANGTRLQENSTGLGNISAQYGREWSHGGITVLGYHLREQFHSSFTAVDAARATERLTTLQRVPSTAFGYAITGRQEGSGWSVLYGADLNRTEGTSFERSFPTGSKALGGSLLQHGYYAQANRRWHNFNLFAGGRPQWIGDNNFFFAPNGGVTYGVRSLRLRASAYRAYRAATLNELYRDFRQGNTLTQANRLLKPEILNGVEAGADWALEHGRLSVTVFRNDLRGLVSNVTLSTGATIIRQRQNASDALSRGLEASYAVPLAMFRVELSYLYAESRLVTGPRLPQIPKHQGSAWLTWHNQRTTIAGGLRAYAYQFDDDLNRFRLPGFAALQFTAQHQLRSHFALTFAMENAADRQFLVGFSPTPLIGAPRQIRAGFRIN